MSQIVTGVGNWGQFRSRHGGLIWHMCIEKVMGIAEIGHLSYCHHEQDQFVAENAEMGHRNREEYVQGERGNKRKKMRC